MHIISKFHDYYDSAMGLGVDRSLVYNRVQEPGEFITGAPRWGYDVKKESHRVGYNPSDVVTIESWVVPVIFCGKLYKRGIADVTTRNPAIGTGAYVPSTVTQRYTADSRKAVLARVYAEHRLNEKTEEKPRYSRWYGLKDDRVTFTEWANARDWIPVHIAEGCPVFLIRNLTQEESYARRGKWNEGPVYRIERNPNLKEVGFYQDKDAYTAFQELSMFLGGVMGSSGRPMVQLSDKEVHAKHGFDKWSFRKPPER